MKQFLLALIFVAPSAFAASSGFHQGWQLLSSASNSPGCARAIWIGAQLPSDPDRYTVRLTSDDQSVEEIWEVGTTEDAQTKAVVTTNADLLSKQLYRKSFFFGDELTGVETLSLLANGEELEYRASDGSQVTMLCAFRPSTSL